MCIANNDLSLSKARKNLDHRFVAFVRLGSASPRADAQTAGGRSRADRAALSLVVADEVSRLGCSRDTTKMRDIFDEGHDQNNRQYGA